MDAAADKNAARNAYRAGWEAYERGAPDALDKADMRRVVREWYSGFHDAAAGRPKWHEMKCDGCNEWDHGDTPAPARRPNHPPTMTWETWRKMGRAKQWAYQSRCPHEHVELLDTLPRCSD